MSTGTPPQTGDLPSGTITLVFSDVEGSTSLLARLGDGYTAVLDAQRRIQRAAWVAHGGTELGTEGDSFFVVFARAGDAVAATVQAQTELAGHPWPPGSPVRVRMGVHTGSPARHADGYVGMDVHRAARIAAAAHGGQVLLSASTATLVDGDLPAGVGIRDLGPHRLKDIPRQERLFQLTGLEQDDFPPPHTLGSASNLPRVGSELIGRERELRELTGLLTSSTGLVTITGTAGAGKTRLALAVARDLVDRFDDGVFFVPLSAVAEADGVWPALGSALSVPVDERTPPRLLSHLAGRRMLLVLDNLEQIAGAGTVLLELLERAPEVTILVTSRRALRVRAERAYPLAPLDLPAEGAPAGSSGAVQLFVAEARRVRPDFTLTPQNTADVVAILTSLDGLPLAIELVAARLALMSPATLRARLDGVLDLRLRAADRPDRQETLRGAIGWSYDLLDPLQQKLFRLLGGFEGGLSVAGLERVAQLAGLDLPVPQLLGDLVEASLVAVVDVQAEAGDDVQVTMLDTIRVFARDALVTAGEAEAANRAHATYIRDVALVLSTSLIGRATAARARFEAHLPDLRAAMDWSVTGPADDAARIRIGVGLGAGTGRMWRDSANQAEGRRRLLQAVRAAERLAAHDWAELAFCHLWLGFLHLEADLDDAGRHAEEGLALMRRLSPGGLPSVEALLGRVRMEQGRLDEAATLLSEAVQLAGAAADGGPLEQRYQYLLILNEAGVLASARQRYEQSLTLFGRAGELAADLGDEQHQLGSRHNAAWVLNLMGEHAMAAELIRQVIPGALALGLPRFLVNLADDFVVVLTALGQTGPAVRLLAGADRFRQEIDLPRSASERSRPEFDQASARAQLGDEAWRAATEHGRTTPLPQLLAESAGQGSDGRMG